MKDSKIFDEEENPKKNEFRSSAFSQATTNFFTASIESSNRTIDT